MKLLLKMSVVAALLSACSGGGDGGVMDGIMTSWKGASLNQVIDAWGFPHAEQDIAGRKLYVWNNEIQLTMPATATTTGYASTYGGQTFYSGTTNVMGGGISNWSCTRILEVNNSNIVIGGEWRGNNCPFMEAGPYAKWRRKS
jgi:hypothetical protein